jgi:hypothetical protein
MSGENEFYVAGSGVLVTFRPSHADGTMAGVLRMEEGSFANGMWISGRRLNGDEDHQGRHLHLPGGGFSIRKVQLYTYK